MSLAEDARGALREGVRADLPIAADGVYLADRPCMGRSWKVLGTLDVSCKQYAQSLLNGLPRDPQERSDGDSG